MYEPYNMSVTRPAHSTAHLMFLHASRKLELGRRLEGSRALAETN
jgi:hypothetical protein